MTTTHSYSFTAGNGYVEITYPGGGSKRFTSEPGQTANLPPEARAAAHEYAANGTASGTVSVTAA